MATKKKMGSASRPRQRATPGLVSERLAQGRTGEAQLAAAALLEANPGDLKAWRLLNGALLRGGALRSAKASMEALSRAFGAQSDLPMALVTALEVAELGAPVEPLLRELAKTYSTQAAQGVSEHWRTLPPPVPRAVEVDLSAASDPAAVEARVKAALEAAASDPASRPSLSGGRDFPLLSALSVEGFVRFAKRLRRVERPEGDTLIRQGERGKSFFIIARGEVEVLRRSADGGERPLARLGPGAFFGEMAIVSRAPRAAEVRAVTEVTLLEAEMAELGQEAGEAPELRQVLVSFCRTRMLQNVLAASPVLRRVPVEERSSVLSRFTETLHPKGAVIIHEGAESTGLYLLVSGEVSISRRDAGEVLSLARLGPGDFFGEISLVLRRPAVASVTALSETVSLLLPREAFLDTVQDHPELLAELYQTALKREEETASIVAREAESADELVLV